ETVYDAAGNATATRSYAHAINLSALPATAGIADVRASLQVDAGQDRVQQRAFDAANRQVYSVDAQGYVKENRYDGVGRVVSTTAYATAIDVGMTATVGTVATALQADAANDQTSSFVFDAQGRLVSSTDALNHTETNTYD